MAIQQLLTEYKLTAEGYSLNDSQCFVHTLPGVVHGPLASESPGV